MKREDFIHFTSTTGIDCYISNFQIMLGPDGFLRVRFPTNTVMEELSENDLDPADVKRLKKILGK